jgi:HPt (histidine-containing phosphotransfer) domain-containing protein
MGEGDEAANALITAAGAPAALDVASLQALGDLVGDDPELLGSLVDVFLEEAPVRLSELRSGLESGDAVLLGRAAHTLKSNALTFGALELADLSERLELMARGGDLSEARALVERAAIEWMRVEPLFEALRRKSAS